MRFGARQRLQCAEPYRMHALLVWLSQACTVLTALEPCGATREPRVQRGNQFSTLDRAPMPDGKGDTFFYNFESMASILDSLMPYVRLYSAQFRILSHNCLLPPVDDRDAFAFCLCSVSCRSLWFSLAVPYIFFAYLTHFRIYPWLPISRLQVQRTYNT